MSRYRLSTALLLAMLAAACGGGGGGGGGSSSPPPAPPPPPPPPPAPLPGPTHPATALARPVSPTTLCGNGAAKRAAAVSSDSFVAVSAGVGITHWHAVDAAVWGQAPGSLESVMRSGAVVASFADDDCWPDLVFATGATASGQLVVYDNRQGLGFSQRLLSVTPAANPIAAVGTADIDGDYRLDLALGNLLDGNLQIWRNTGPAGYALLQSLASARSTFGFAFADYSGDQWLDVFAAHWDIEPPVTAAPALLRNLGDDTGLPTGWLVGADAEAGMAAVPRDFNLAPAFVDLDRDGRSDLLIASDFGTSQALLNGAGNVYASLPGVVLSDENAAGQAVADFDNDGNQDWFVASVIGPGDTRPWPWGVEGGKLYWGEASSPYLAAAVGGTGVEDAGFPWGVCAEDFNNDGFVDLFVENGFGYAPPAVLAAHSGDPFVQQINDSLFDQQFQQPRLLINQGNRTFVDEAAAWGLTDLTDGRGVACLDYDRDGDVDIAVAQNSQPAVLYENRHAAPDGNRFLAVRLVSIAPNTQAVGAEVTVEAGGLTQRRLAGASGSFQGQQATALHFGLAGATIVDTVTVDWPDGTTSTYSDLPADRTLTLIDPRMLPYVDAGRASRIEAAIASALVYAANPLVLDNDILLGLSWMERMHGIALTYSPGDVLNARVLSSGPAESLQLRIWRRHYDPLYQIAADDYDGLADFDAITFAAVYCHQFPLGDSNVQDIAGFAAGGAAGGYSTTHALLALVWAIDNDCAMPPAYDQSLLSTIVRDVYAIADAGGSTTFTDLRVEAMAFLAAAGRQDLIQAPWVDQLLDAQLPDGGWKAAPANADAADHTTGLALWLLLQLSEETKVLSGYVAQPWDP